MKRGERIANRKYADLETRAKLAALRKERGMQRKIAIRNPGDLKEATRFNEIQDQIEALGGK